MMSLAAADRNALLELKTGMLSDALDSFGLAGGCAGLRPLSSHMRMVGPALTLRYLRKGTTDGTVDEFLHLADLVREVLFGFVDAFSAPVGNDGYQRHCMLEAMQTLIVERRDVAIFVEPYS